MVPELPVENPEEARIQLEEINAEIVNLGEHVLAEKTRREGFKVKINLRQGGKREKEAQLHSVHPRVTEHRERERRAARAVPEG